MDSEQATTLINFPLLSIHLLIANYQYHQYLLTSPKPSLLSTIICFYNNCIIMVHEILYIPGSKPTYQIERNAQFTMGISPHKETSTGVRQESVLGLILFLICINDIAKVFSHANVFLFSDDTTLYFTGPSNDTLFHSANEDIDKLYSWCFGNRLT